MKDRLSGRVIQGAIMGPRPYLTATEEKEQVKFLCNCSKMARKTRGAVLQIVEAAKNKKGRKLEGSLMEAPWPYVVNYVVN